MFAVMRKLTKKLRANWSDRRGTAAIEFAFFVGLLSLGVLNTADVSIYIYQRMQLENASEMAAQSAWKTCDPSLGYVPATTNCPGLTTAITKALQSTSLGTKVTLQSGSPTEGYYCVNSSNALQYVSGVSSKPTDCTAAGMPSLQPVDYINVTATFVYAPLFPGVTVASAFTTPMTKTALMRME
ncbi:MAG TPA: TadE/TadG family type IV pilus assembly protein [Pirellulales bacterium]